MNEDDLADFLRAKWRSEANKILTVPQGPPSATASLPAAALAEFLLLNGQTNGLALATVKAATLLSVSADDGFFDWIEDRVEANNQRQLNLLRAAWN